MKRKPAKIPKGYHTITPYFSLRNAHRLIEFLKKTFGGKAKNVMTMSNGKVMSAEVHIGDSIVFIGEENSDRPFGKDIRGMFYMYVTDVDAVYKKAMRAGGKSFQKPRDEMWGERVAIVDDIGGNRWCIAAQQEEVSTEEMVALASERSRKKSS
jgi:PhnB protein